MVDYYYFFKSKKPRNDAQNFQTVGITELEKNFKLFSNHSIRIPGSEILAEIKS